MTRDEAIKKVNSVPCPAGYSRAQVLVDSLICLDILRVDEPKDAKTLAIQTLSMTTIGGGYKTFVLDAAYAFDIIAALEAAGLEIVRK